MNINNNVKSIYRTPKNYFYKITKNQKKKRIGIKEFQFLEKNLKLDQVSYSTQQTTTTFKTTNSINIKNCCGIDFLKTLNNNSINLILTDPPYIISKNTGMNLLKNSKKKDKKYGTKYAYSTDFGKWDKTFTLDLLEKFLSLYYQKLVSGGTLILWIDLWKISLIKNLLEKKKFKQIRFIEWIKKNPVPLNSKKNYLNNSREVALIAVKEKNPTFNSAYDNGIYYYPIVSGKNRIHPTQKNLQLFIDLINKHSNRNDTVLDTFLGSGTTLFACIKTGRNFHGCEINKNYFQKINKIWQKQTT